MHGCTMRVQPQMATVGKSRNDSICAAVDAVSDAEKDAANWIGLCRDSRCICTRINRGNPLSDAITYVFYLIFKKAECIGGKVVTYFICHRGLKRAVAETTNISSRSSCRRKSSPHAGVVNNCKYNVDSICTGAFGVCFATLCCPD